MYQNSASFQARFHTARRDDKGLATSISTWRQTKDEVKARDEEGAGEDDVEARYEGAAGDDEGEARDVKALAGDKEGDGAAVHRRGGRGRHRVLRGDEEEGPPHAPEKRA